MQRGTTYELSLNLYFDDIHAAPGLMDPSIAVYIFEKGTDKMVTPNGVPLVLENKDEFVTYKVPGCSLGEELSTRILYYSTKIDLANYDHPEGYYVVWERCCRNEMIDNIRIPDAVGNTFYMEFPPVFKDGKPFRNSTPKFKDIKGEYFCIGKDQIYDFSAIDSDGDSLVYSLVTPYKGYSMPDGVNAMPVPTPRSQSEPYYPVVDWVTGFSGNNMVPGEPPLTIDENSGHISVTPTSEGLFVMAVKVEEYRNGELIGMSRRDFQFMVVSCPYSPKNIAPSVTIKDEKLDKILTPSDTIVVPQCEEICLSVETSDESVYALSGGEEIVSIEIEGEIPSHIYTINPLSGKLIETSPESTHDLCFKNCTGSGSGKDTVIQVHVTAFDDECPAPFFDEAIINILVEGGLIFPNGLYDGKGIDTKYGSGARIWNADQVLYVSNLPASAIITINDLKGNVVYNSTLSKGDSSIDISTIGKGFYIVNVYDKNNLKIQTKLVK